MKTYVHKKLTQNILSTYSSQPYIGNKPKCLGIGD